MWHKGKEIACKNPIPAHILHTSKVRQYNIGNSLAALSKILPLNSGKTQNVLTPLPTAPTFCASKPPKWLWSFA